MNEGVVRSLELTINHVVEARPSRNRCCYVPLLFTFRWPPRTHHADVAGCFGILFSLLGKTDKPSVMVGPLSMEIATKILEKVDDKAPLRLNL